MRDSVGKLKLALSKQLGPVTRTLVAGVLVLALPLLFACRVDKILSSATPKVALVLPANSVGLADSLRLIANVEVGGVTQPELRVFWTSSDSTVARVDSVTGTVRGLVRGNAVITARLSPSALSEAPESAQAAIHVVIPRVSLTDSTFTALQETICLRFEAFDARGTVVTGIAPAYVIALDPDNTLAPGIGAGCYVARKAGVPAKVVAAVDTARDTATVTVNQVPVTFNATPDSIRFNSLTADSALKVAAKDRNGYVITTPTVVWTSLNNTIATVVPAGRVTAGGNGVTWIRVQVPADTLRDSVKIIVQQVAKDISVAPGIDTLRAVRGRRTLIATVRDSLGQRIAAATPAFASLASDSVRIVSQGGDSAVVEAVAEGGATITAQQPAGAGLLTGTARIAVRYRLATITVSPAAPTLAVLGDTVRFSATARDTAGNLVTQPRVAWKAQDTSRVVIDSLTGLATARRLGSTAVTARRDTTTGNATATVAPPILSLDNGGLFSDSVLRSSTDTVSTTRRIANTGTGTLGVKLAVLHGASWLTITPDTVTVPTATSTPVRITATAGTLAEGTYTDTVRLRSVGADSAPRDIAVRFKVYCPLVAIAPDTVIAASIAATDCGARHQAGSYADYYAFSGATGDTVGITMTTGAQTDLDTYLYLLNAAGSVVALNDDCPGLGRNSCLQIVLPASGQYTIEATTFSARAAFAYSLALTRPRPPVAPAALGQFLQDNSVVPAGGSINSSTIVLKATGQDPNSRDTLRLQVEVRTAATAFTNTPTDTGAPAPNGAGGVVLSKTVTGLVNGQGYHWQARVIDQTARLGPWTAFGIGGADFSVNITNPVLTLTRSTIVDTVPAGATVPLVSGLKVLNTGTGTFTWSTAKDSVWMSVVPPGSGNPSDSLKISVDPTGKAAGTYTGTVTVTAAGAAGSPGAITVTLVVQQSILAVTPDSVVRSTNVGSASFTDTLRISNSGNGTLSWTAVEAPTATWLALGKSAGSAPDKIPLTINSGGLAAGPYTDTVVVTAAGATGSPKKVLVRLTVHQPLLAVTPAALKDSANFGASGPAAAKKYTLRVTNADGGTLTWSAVKSHAWVTLSKSAGSAPDSLDVTLQPDTLSAGIHRDTIVFTSPEANNGPIRVPVEFQILQPVLSVAPASLADSAVQFDTTKRVRSLTMTNTGTGTLAWTAVKDSAWISVSPASGAPPQALTVTINPSGHPVGTYTGSVTVSALNAAGSPKSIPVTLKITPPPVLSLAPTSYSDSAFQGSALARNFVLHVANTGTGTLNWSATTDTTWLTASKVSGSATGGAPDSTTITLTPGTLASGTHAGVVTVTAPFSSGSPATVPVTFKIKPCLQPTVVPDSTIAGTVAASDCGAPHRTGKQAKLYSVMASAGDTLTVRMTSAAFNAYLVMADSLGNLLSQNDDCPSFGTNACIVNFGVPGPGRYVIEATTFAAGATGAFTLSVVKERPPTAPSGIGQLRRDGTTAIAIGGVTTEDSVVLVGTIKDPNPSDSVRLEVEVVQIPSPFVNAATRVSAFVAVTPAGQSVAIRVGGLVENKGYHWQARTCDRTGRCSAWADFGGNPQTAGDFFVNAIPETPADPTAVNQFQSNGTTVIPVGGGAGSNPATVIFKSVVADPDPGDVIVLEVEVKTTTSANGFDGTGLTRGTGVATNGTASVSVTLSPGLLGANYFWRARACDQTTRCSAWVSFGGNKDTVQILNPAATDFSVP